ncbi:hypothetical protein [Actinoplanes sp. NPDC051494]|uniref:hypothetical protein n=1 Tax=Actinoplanes sp. NPDC051494 TaxID=3363907 RepID=UPI0037957CB3
MTYGSLVALSIAVSGCLLYATASILQALAARRSTSTVTMLRHPLYLGGVAADILAWGGSMVALSVLAVYVVESILASSLALTVLGARLFLRAHLRRVDVAAVAVTITALAVLAMSAGPQHAVLVSDVLRVGFCTAAVTLALTGWTVVRAGAPAGVVAAVAGLGMGGAAVTGRALPVPGATLLDKALALVTEPMAGALLVFAVTGMLLYAQALQRGQVGPVTAVLWIAEVVAPSAVAILLLGDRVRPGWELAAGTAALVTVAAAVLLSAAPATGATDATVEQLPAARPARVHILATSVPGAWPGQSAGADAVRRAAARVIWWGAPPVWKPPARALGAAPAASPSPAVLDASPLPAVLDASPAQAVLDASPAQAALTWSPPLVLPDWASPQPADADSLPAPAPVPAARWTAPAAAHPWHDLSSVADGD